MKKHIIFVFLFFLVAKNFAQFNPEISVYNKSNGLPSNIIYDIKIAKNGLLYIAHENGLSQFDGTQFIHFYNADFPNIAVSNIIETQNGNIFCKSFNNTLFGLKNDTLHIEKSFNENMLFFYSEAIGNNIVGINNFDLYIYNTLSKTIKLKNLYDTISKQNLKGIQTILLDKSIKDQLIYVDSNYNFYIENIEKNKQFLLHYFNQKNELSLKTLEWKLHQKFSKMYINNILQIENDIWFCTSSGAYRLAQNNVETMHVLADCNVSYIQKDRENNFWFSTTNDGLKMISNFNLNQINSTTSTYSAFYGNKENIFIGTTNGEIKLFLTKSNSIKNIITSNITKSIEKVFFDTISQSLFFNSDMVYQMQNKKLYKDGLALKDFYFLKGNILLATNYGLYFYQNNDSQLSWLNNVLQDYVSQNHEIKNLKIINNINYRISHVAANVTKEDIYFATSKGIFLINESHTDPLMLCAINNKIFDMIYFNNQLLISSSDKGVCIIKNNQLIPLFTNNKIGIVQKMHVFENQLWLQTSIGIYKIIDNSFFQSYSYSEGLPINKIIDFYVNKNVMYCLLNNSLLYFEIDKIKKEYVKPKLDIYRINHLQIKNQYKNLAEFNYKENNIQINYSLIAFNNPTNNTIAYSINNENLIFNEPGMRSIKLPSLQSGNYEIKFYTVTNNIVNNEIASVFFLNISTPFWKTIWFYIFLFCLASILLFVIIKKIINKQKKDNELIQSKILLEQQLDKSMLASIKAQMNPHFLFNALNTIQSYIYSNDKKNASEYIGKFSDLTRSILDMSNKDTINLIEEIKALKLYLELEKMRFEDTFHYDIEIDKNINTNLVRMPSMLVQPYVENAIKHGLLHKKHNRILKINFSKNNNLIKISVEDNGIGRKRSSELNKIKNRQHQSFAMNANKKRLELLKTNYTDIAFEIIDLYSPLGEPMGTKVMITLPII